MSDLASSIAQPKKRNSTGKKFRNISLVIALLGLYAIVTGDFTLYHTEPDLVLQRMLSGVLHLDFGRGQELFEAVTYTIAFAVLGVGAAIIPGFILSLCYQFAAIRVICGFGRAVHELFWGLLFLQVFGLSTLTGILAIAVPFSCIFAKVYSEQMAAHSKHCYQPAGDRVSVLVYSRLAASWQALRHYSRYRFECGLRSATLLGFIGLPTIGYALDTALKQQQYDQAMALLFTFYLLSASIRYWLRPMTLPILLFGSLLLLPSTSTLQSSGLWSFISHDLLPYPLQQGISLESLSGTLSWCWTLLESVGFKAIVNTLLLTCAATLASGVLCLLLFPLAASRSKLALIGKPLLVMLRATPELLLVFIVLLITGPSMLPALIALALHNGALLAFLLAKQLDNTPAPPLAISGCNSWGYFWLPKLYGAFLSLLLYRSENILRESAIVGMVGIATLGFYIDSGFEDLQVDVAFFFIIITAGLTLMVDYCSRGIQRYTGIRS
ncbi:phosphonate transport system permease protein [Sinobacterium caligoides]|uniref:Phosphonate transport system permease protein n=1 Tax=Sinobacterium caligoides TaxID=933926 RepID=A0A3N2DGN4_9GAMM|nr:hypothetical protein [Sinobacterium caligoides]ROR98963.1 phosphonate transport system permease protein [Sinobacterium caligoides]